MSPLLEARAPYDVKGAELSHSHIYRMASMQNVGRVKYQRWILAQLFLKRKRALLYCLAFCFSTALPTIAKVNQLYT